MTRFSGVFVALLTPFDADGRVDEGALRAHIDALVADGIHGFVPVGSTGEAMSLDREEWERVICVTVDQVAGRAPVVPGCSANATHHVIRNCEFAQHAGADGLMITHPFYNHPTDDELLQHYGDIAAAAELPIFVYNNPGTTGVDASPELLGRMSRFPHVEYVKETSGDSSRVTRIQECAEGRLAVFGGQDNQVLEQFVCGAVGWISGTANVLAAQCVALYEAAVVRGDYASARVLYRDLHPFLEHVEMSGRGIQTIKACMELSGRPLGAVRPPLRPLSAADLETARDHLRRALSAPLPVA
ncbi:MAG TPA: 4-hydroxy-tetrahydrodipicolinate synthase [Candidatus Limnocylindrales bacterium]